MKVTSVDAIKDIVLKNRYLLGDIEMYDGRGIGEEFTFSIKSDTSNNYSAFYYDLFHRVYGRADPEIRHLIYELEYKIKNIVSSIPNHPEIQCPDDIMIGIRYNETLNIESDAEPEWIKRKNPYNIENAEYEVVLDKNDPYTNTDDPFNEGKKMYCPNLIEYRQDIALCRKFNEACIRNNCSPFKFVPCVIPLLKSINIDSLTWNDIGKIKADFIKCITNGMFELPLFTDSVNNAFTELNIQAQTQVILLYGLCNRLDELTYI